MTETVMRHGAAPRHSETPRSSPAPHTVLAHTSDRTADPRLNNRYGLRRLSRPTATPRATAPYPVPRVLYIYRLPVHMGEKDG